MLRETEVVVVAVVAVVVDAWVHTRVNGSGFGREAMQKRRGGRECDGQH